MATGQARSQVDELNRQALRQMRKAPDSCRTILSKSIKIAESEGYFKGLGNAFNIRARLSELEGDDLAAFETYQKALTFYAQTDSVVSNNQAIVLRNMAAIFLDKYQYEEAVKYYDSAEYFLRQYMVAQPDRAEKTNKLKSLNDIIYFKAIAQKYTGRLSDANITLNQLWNQGIDERKNVNYARTLNQLGLVNIDLQNYHEARYYFRQMMELEKVSDLYIARAHHNIGMAWLAEGKYKKAQGCFEKSLEVKQSFKSSELKQKLLFHSYLELGESFFRQENFIEAIEQWEKALSFDVDISEDPEYYVVHNWLQQSYMLFDLTKANVHGEKFKSYSKAFHKSKLTLAEQLESQVFTLSLAENKLKETHGQESAAQQTQFKVILVVVAIAALLLFLAWLLRRKIRHHRYYRQMHSLATNKS